jgi:hypothetical protein
VIDLNELLPALQKYRELYWAVREQELQGYVEHFRRRETGDDEDEDNFDVEGHNRFMDLYSECQRAELRLMQLLQSEPTPEAARLMKELEPYE